MKKLLTILICLYFHVLHSEESVKEVVFVSLGSHCEVSMKLSAHQLRYFSTPVDWMLTQDHEGFVRLIDEGFEHFLVDFRHDWPDTDFYKHLPDIQEKYDRRVKRFFNLSDLAKRVVFIRSAFDRKLNVANNMPFDTPESAVITVDQALELKEVLKKQFPTTDFILVIVNYDESACEAEGILEWVVRKDLKLEDYKELVDLLNDPGKYDALKLTMEPI